MSTLREQAEKLVAEALPCLAPTGFARCGDNVPGSYSLICGNCNKRLNALSAVLKGMRLLLQGTPHLRYIDQGSGIVADFTMALHDEKQCKRLGGACRVKEIK